MRPGYRSKAFSLNKFRHFELFPRERADPVPVSRLPPVLQCVLNWLNCCLIARLHSRLALRGAAAMLTSLAAAVLNRVLGEFVEDFDPKNLSFALGQGEAGASGRAQRDGEEEGRRERARGGSARRQPIE